MFGKSVLFSFSRHSKYNPLHHLNGINMSATIPAGWISWLVLSQLIAFGMAGGSGVDTQIFDPRPGRSVCEEDNVFLRQPRIVGGSNSPQGRYPYFVSMLDISGRHTCGGTLVAPDIVLTAAHCRGSAVRVQVGRWDRQSATDNYDEISISFPEFPHPDYSDDGFRNDFMLLKLTSPSTKPVIRLNADPTVPRGNIPDEVTVIGFGNTLFGVSSFADILQEVSLSYIPNSICEQAKDPTMNLSYQHQILDSMLCAGDQGEDSCQGDSGGPLILSGGTSSQDVMVGIISWGFGCALENFPGVYSRISSRTDWLRNNICRMSMTPPEYLDCEVPSTIPPRSIPVTVAIQFDDFPEELSWSMQDETGVNTYAEVPFGTYTEARSRIHETVFLPGGQRFLFQINDSFGDGLCCNQPGNYLVSLGSRPNGDILVSGGGSFDTTLTHEFDVPIYFEEETTDVFDMGPNQIPLTIVMQLDSYPHEIGWKVERLGIEVESIIDVPAGVYRIPDARIVRTLILEKGELYYFRCYDISSDGIDNGFVKLFLGTADVEEESKLIHEADGDFNGGFDFSFLATMEQGPTEGPLFESEAFVTLYLYFDLYPGEVGVQLRANSDEVANGRQKMEDTVIFFRPPRYYSDHVNERVIERIPIPRPHLGANRDFTLIVTDSFSDGLCCNWNSTEQTGYTLYNGAPGVVDVLIDSRFVGVGREVNTFTIYGPAGGDDNDVAAEKPEDLIDIKVTITLDVFPDETGFYIVDESGYKVADFPPGTYRDLEGLVEEYLTIPAGVYTFTITDVYGDGINRDENTYFRIDIVGAKDRPPVLAGAGLFVYQKTCMFALEGRAADYPMTIKFITDDKPEEFAFTVKRLDLLESDVFVASVSRGSYTEQGSQSETIMVVEGALYRIFFEDAGKDGTGTGQIEIVMGSDSAGGFNAHVYTVDASELSATQLKVYAGQLSKDMDGPQLDLRLTFDQFPNEVRP
jgi:trypsin